MAKFREKPALTLTQDPDSGAFEADPADLGYDSDQEAAYENLRNSGEQQREGMQVWVYMLPTDAAGQVAASGKWEQLFTAPVDRYGLDEILQIVRDDHMGPEGAKRWNVRIVVRKNGQRGYLSNQLFIVRAGIAKVPPGAQQPSQLTEVMAQFRQMMEAQQQRQDALLAQLARPAPPAVDPTQTALNMVQALSQMAATMIQKTAPAPAGGILEMITTLRAVKGLSDDLSPGDGGGRREGGAMGVVRELLPLAKPILEALAQRAGQPAPQPMLSAPPSMPLPITPAQPVPPAAPAGYPEAQFGAPLGKQEDQPVSASTQATKDQQRAELVALLGGLADLSAATPPCAPQTAAAEIVKTLAALPDDDLNSALDVLENPLWFTILASLQPKMAGKETWFSQVREIVIATEWDALAPPQA